LLFLIICFPPTAVLTADILTVPASVKLYVTYHWSLLLS